MKYWSLLFFPLETLIKIMYDKKAEQKTNKQTKGFYENNTKTNEIILIEEIFLLTCHVT